MHVAAPQGVFVSARVHFPVPSQVPLLPQGLLLEVAHCPEGAALFAGRFAQVPALPATLHAWHIPQAEEAQQTPSTQLSPVRQLLVVPVIVHGCPCR